MLQIRTLGFYANVILQILVPYVNTYSSLSEELFPYIGNLFIFTFLYSKYLYNCIVRMLYFSEIYNCTVILWENTHICRKYIPRYLETRVISCTPDKRQTGGERSDKSHGM